MKLFIANILLIVSCWAAVAQSLMPDLLAGDNVNEINQRAALYFNSEGPQVKSDFKHYMRWKHHMRFRADMQGNIRNFQAMNMREAERVAVNFRSTHGEWEDLGPSDYTVSDTYSGGGIGRVNCIAFHPSNSNTMWIGTPAGGLWKTTDGGTTWTAWTDAFASIAISGIAINYNNPDIMYILTGDGDGRNAASIGVLKSENGGFTWRQILSLNVNDFEFGYKLVMHPTNPQVLYVVSTLGITKTSTGGNFWANVYAGAAVSDIEFHPANPDTMYAATRHIINSNWQQARFIRSTQSGASGSWMEISDPDFPDTSSRCAIAVSPSTPSTVYVVFGGQALPSGTYKGLFKSSDHGSTFTEQSSTPNILGPASDGGGIEQQAWYDLSIVVDPSNDQVVYVGAVNLWKSTNSGVHWDRQTWWLRNDVQPYVHADWHALEFQGSTLYAGVDGGVYKTADGGASWTELSQGLSNMQFYEIDIHNGVYIGGTQDNGTNEAGVTNPQTHNIMGGDGFGCTWHSGNDQIQYLSSQNSIARRQFGSNIFIWEVENGFWNTDIKMHTTNTNYLFLDRDQELFRAHEVLPPVYVWDSLKTSPLLSVYSSPSDILGYSQGTSDPEVMYVLNNWRLIKTSNLSAGDPTWDTLPHPNFGLALSDVVVDPNNTDRVWITYGGYQAGSKVYFSDDGGMTWLNISGSLPNVPVRCLVHHQGTNDDIYVGTEIGVFFRDNGLSDWIYFSNYLPKTIVSDLVISGSYIYAGTFGRGLWRSNTYSTCPLNLVLTPENDGNPFSTGLQIHHASNSITSTRFLNGGLGTEVFYNAANYVDMKPGFWAKTENFMEAKIGGCPD